MGNVVGEEHLPRSLIHCRLQQPYLLVQGTSHTQDLPTGTQMLVARDPAPTIRSTAPSPHPRQARRGGCVLLSSSLWPGEHCGSPSGAVDWEGGAHGDFSSSISTHCFSRMPRGYSSGLRPHSSDSELSPPQLWRGFNIWNIKVGVQLGKKDHWGRTGITVSGPSGVTTVSPPDLEMWEHELLLWVPNLHGPERARTEVEAKMG